MLTSFPALSCFHMKLRCLCHLSLLIIVVAKFPPLLTVVMFKLSHSSSFLFLLSWLPFPSFHILLFFFPVDRSWGKNQLQSPPEFNQYCVLANGSWPFCPHEHRFVNAKGYSRLSSMNLIYYHRPWSFCSAQKFVQLVTLMGTSTTCFQPWRRNWFPVSSWPLKKNTPFKLTAAWISSVGGMSVCWAGVQRCQPTAPWQALNRDFKIQRRGRRRERKKKKQ